MAASPEYTGRERAVTYVGILLGYLFDGYDLIIISFILSPLIIYFNTSLGAVSLAIAISLVGAVAGGIFFGWLADRIGRRNSLLITIALFGVMTVLTGFINSLTELYALRFLAGLGIGGEWGVGFSLLSESWPAGTRGTAGGALQSMFIVGSLAGAVTAGYMLSVYGPAVGWRYSFIAAGGLALALLPLRLLMPESKAWSDYNRRRKSGNLSRDYDVRSPILQIFSRGYVSRTILFTLLAGAFLFFVYSFISFIPSYFGAYGIPVPTYTTIIVIAELAGIGGLMLDGLLSDLIGRRRAAIVFASVSIVSVLFFLYEALVAPRFTGIYSFPLFYAYAAIYFATGFGGNLGIWIGENYLTKMRATATNFTYMVGRGLGAGLAPILIPIWASSLGLGMAMSVGMVIGVAIQFLVVFGIRETKGTRITAL
jgi:MFS family permease